MGPLTTTMSLKNVFSSEARGQRGGGLDLEGRDLEGRVRAAEARRHVPGEEPLAAHSEGSPFLTSGPDPINRIPA